MRVRVPTQADLSSTDARRIFCALDADVDAYRAMSCEYDADDDCGVWYAATMPDHWADGVEIHWGESVSA